MEARPGLVTTLPARGSLFRASDEDVGEKCADEGESAEKEDGAQGAGLEVGTEDVAEDGIDVVCHGVIRIRCDRALIAAPRNGAMGCFLEGVYGCASRR